MGYTCNILFTSLVKDRSLKGSLRTETIYFEHETHNTEQRSNIN